MSLTFSFAAGQRLLALDLDNAFASVAAQTATKGGDTARTSTTTLTADPELSIPVAANCWYLMTGLLRYNAGATPGIKISWSAPSGAVMSWTANCLDSGITAAGSGIIDRIRRSISASVQMGINGTATDVVAHPVGLLQVSSTAGNFALTWAQNTSNATAATMKQDSTLALVRIL